MLLSPSATRPPEALIPDRDDLALAWCHWCHRGRVQHTDDTDRRCDYCDGRIELHQGRP